jgi:CRISPR-associated exonuclease Cas4
VSSGDRIAEYVRKEREVGARPKVPITGLMVQYYHVCRRELWFMFRGIDIDRETPNIQRGTHVDETSYQESRRSFLIGNRIQLDLLESGAVMEVKVSSTLEKPARMQLLFYLWFLEEVYDIERDGVLAYPTERKREPVQLDDRSRAAVERTIIGVLDVVDQDAPPELSKKPYCDSCLYQDLCWM